MQQSSNNSGVAHALLQIRRFPRKAVWQTLPSFISGLIFSKLYLLMNHDHPAYITVFLLITVLLLALVTVVIYYRESTLELDALLYLFIAGYSPSRIAVLVFTKWVILTIAGTLLAGGYTLISALWSGGNLISLTKGLGLAFLCLNLFFLLSLGTTIILYALRKWKIS